MAVIAEIHEGDIGTIIRATIKDKQADGTLSVLDISGATTLELVFKKPSGTKLTKVAVLTTDGTDGQMEYVTISGDLNETGEWKIQAYIVLPSGSWRSDIGCFTVFENL